MKKKFASGVVTYPRSGLEVLDEYISAIESMEYSWGWYEGKVMDLVGMANAHWEGEARRLMGEKRGEWDAQRGEFLRLRGGVGEEDG
ncbi:MAG: hypothetical protein ACUVXI_17670 [bacterium]